MHATELRMFPPPSFEGKAGPLPSGGSFSILPP